MRKPWDELSDNYRKRLARAGIGPEQHAQGATIQSARGHTTDEAFRKRVNVFVKRYEQLYARIRDGFPEPANADNMRRLLRRMGQVDADAWMKDQQRAERQYNDGERSAATQTFQAREGISRLPFYYHGLFS